MRPGKPSGFYVVVSEWAMFGDDAAVLEPSDRLVLLALAFHGPTCTAGKFRIGRMTGLDPKTASTSTRRLEALGFLSRPAPEPGKASRWTVAPHLHRGHEAPGQPGADRGRTGGGPGASAPPNSEQGTTNREEEDFAPPDRSSDDASSLDAEEDQPMPDDLRAALEMIDAATERLVSLYFTRPTFDQREHAAMMLTRTAEFHAGWLTAEDVAGSCVERSGRVRKWAAFFGTDRAVRATAEAACQHRRRRENLAPAPPAGRQAGGNVPTVAAAEVVRRELQREEGRP